MAWKTLSGRVRNDGRKPEPPTPKPGCRGRQAAASVLVGLLCAGFALCGSAAEVVYDNSQYYQTNFYASLGEFGDEVRLSVTNAVLGDFSVEYFGEFVPTGAERARLKIYANDGPDNDPRPDWTIIEPHTVLYDSGDLPLGPGFNALLLRDLKVSVPQTVTWTIQFTGLSGTNGNRAGLLFYDPPTVGRSFDDFWTNGPAGWGLMRFPGGQLVANFSVRAAATNDTSLFLEPPQFAANGQATLNLTGPLGRSVRLEFSTNETDWTSLEQLTFTNRAMRFVHTEAAAFHRHYYRAILLPTTLNEIVDFRRLTGGKNRLTLTGPMDGYYRVDASPDLLTWTPILTNVYPAGYAYFEDSSSSGSRFYRVREIDTPAPQPDLTASHPVNEVFQVGWSGPPGSKVAIDVSTDLSTWVPIRTNMFSFTTGAVTIVDEAAKGSPMRYYRLRDLP